MDKDGQPRGVTSPPFSQLERDAARMRAALRPGLEAVRALETMNRHRVELEKFMRPITSAGELDTVSRIAREFEKQSNRILELTRPLAQVYEMVRISEQATKALDRYPLGTVLSKEFERLHNQTHSAFAEIQRSLHAAEESRRALLDGVAKTQLSRIDALAAPFARLRELPNVSNSPSFQQALDAIRSVSAMSEALRLPIIDRSAAAVIAKFWGAEGVERQLRSFGIDYEKLLQGVEGVRTDRALVEPQTQAGRRLPDFWTVASIILAILMFLYQDWDAAQTEGRLVGEIRGTADRHSKQIDALESLLRETLAAVQPVETGQTQFVARAKVAPIRRDPRSGSTVIAEVFPNQVVVLIGEKRKWIRVEYFDWLHQETREGWALKKHFLRIQPSLGSLSSDRSHKGK